MTRLLIICAALAFVGLEPTRAQAPAKPRTVAAAEELDRASTAEWRRLERQYFVASTDRREFDEAAAIAWAYVARHYRPETGFVDATVGYPYNTVWDIASGLAALYSAHALELIDDANYDRRMRRVLGSLGTIGLVDNVAFNKLYSARTGDMIGRDRQTSARGYGWSTTDLGRLLVWLKILAQTQPVYAAEAAAIVRRLDFKRLVEGGYLWGQDFDSAWTPHRYQEGQLGYEQYAARGFAAWGASVDRALSLEENGLPLTIAGHALYADARGQDRLTSDPIFLMGLETGWDVPTERLARNLIGVQRARYRRTGRVTMIAEDAISQPPHFFYYYSAFTHRQAFAVDVQARGVHVNDPRWVSAKAAFAWHALVPSSYTRLAVQAVAPARGSEGWASGVFEGSQLSTGSPNVNTAAVILTAALVHRRGQSIMGSWPAAVRQ
jgi:hypothetical protein